MGKLWNSYLCFLNLNHKCNWFELHVSVCPAYGIIILNRSQFLCCWAITVEHLKEREVSFIPISSRSQKKARTFCHTIGNKSVLGQHTVILMCIQS